MESRVKNTARNSLVGIITYMITVILSFLTRTFFIKILGNTYLGLNGLFNDILQILSLAELGVGTAILFAMYRPVAYGDTKKIAAYMNFYKKLYNWIGIIISIIGLLLTPFLNFFVSGIPDLPNIELIYILYLFNTSLSYFFSYKRSMLIANQCTYINTLNIFLFSVIQQFLQIFLLLFTNNYILYLVIQVLCTIFSNIVISMKVDKMYPFLHEYRKEKLNKEEIKNLKINVLSMMASKISSVFVTSTDNILISKFVSTAVLGIYSNYTLVTTMIKTIIQKIFDGLTGSVGNLIAQEVKSKQREMYFNIFFINYLIVSFCCVGFYVLINDFILLWLGTNYILNDVIVLLVSVNLYFRLIRNTTLTYIDTLGLFKKVKIKAIIEALVNLIASIFLVVFIDLGIYGILLGTLISNFVTNYFWEAYIVNQELNISQLFYHKKLFFYLCVSILISFFSKLINCYITLNSLFLNLLIHGLIYVALSIIFYVIFFFHTKEFKYLTSLYKGIILRKFLK